MDLRADAAPDVAELWRRHFADHLKGQDVPAHGPVSADPVAAGTHERGEPAPTLPPGVVDANAAGSVGRGEALAQFEAWRRVRARDLRRAGLSARRTPLLVRVHMYAGRLYAGRLRGGVAVARATFLSLWPLPLPGMARMTHRLLRATPVGGALALAGVLALSAGAVGIGQPGSGHNGAGESAATERSAPSAGETDRRTDATKTAARLTNAERPAPNRAPVPAAYVPDPREVAAGIEALARSADAQRRADTPPRQAAPPAETAGSAVIARPSPRARPNDVRKVKTVAVRADGSLAEPEPTDTPQAIETTEGLATGETHDGDAVPLPARKPEPPAVRRNLRPMASRPSARPATPQAQRWTQDVFAR